MAAAEIIGILKQSGPQTGSELQERTRVEIRELWTACKQAGAIRFEVIGTRFLRLDRAVEGYARLSPSIRREFQTYTVLGLEEQSEQISEKANRLKREVGQISSRKRELSRESMEDALSTVSDRELILDKTCFILAGDITYGMAHAVPRPESSTGELVRGSDLDIVVVTADDLSESHVRDLDQAIYKKKHFLLVHPGYREEIDYLIKSVEKVRKQVAFDTFQFMVACKILHEGELLYGSSRVFDQVKALVDEHQIPAKLDALQERATRSRERAEAILLEPPQDLSDSEVLTLFYTREESEEIF